jgi:hypothetical protein
VQHMFDALKRTMPRLKLAPPRLRQRGRRSDR